MTVQMPDHEALGVLTTRDGRVYPIHELPISEWWDTVFSGHVDALE